MAQQPPDETNTLTNTTLTTTSDTYLSTHLIVPYFINAQGEIKRPEHLIAWWSRIFSFYVPDDKDHIPLRSLCRLFRDALKMPLWTTFPHPKYPTLKLLLARLNTIYAVTAMVKDTKKISNYNQQDNDKLVKIIYLDKGLIEVEDEEDVLLITYPLTLIGAGRNQTIISGGYGFHIQAKKERNKKVQFLNMTICHTCSAGILADGAQEPRSIGFMRHIPHPTNGLSFLCENVTITKCGSGISAIFTAGRLINCIVTQCGENGIRCREHSIIEVEGSLTKVDGNCRAGNRWDYGLLTGRSAVYTDYPLSIIRLLEPLTKESVSTNNGGGGNYGGVKDRDANEDGIHEEAGLIETVLCF
jgi:hypothetical protein